MLANKMVELKYSLNKHGIILSFTGPFSQGIIEEIGAALKKHMGDDERGKSNIYNVFAVFVEQTQNIKNYSLSIKNEEERESILISGVITIGKKGNKYFICSGNLIKNEEIKKITESLKFIEKLDKEDLKKIYKSKMQEREIIRNKKSAGLGFIDMARRASERIDYSISPEKEGFSFFTLNVCV